jgi:hypothetical protein
VSADYAKNSFGPNSLLKPVIKGEDITEFFVPDDSGHVIIYSTKETAASRFPEVIAHLALYRQKLSRKRETVQGKLPWYCLHWPRYPALFNAPKVVLRQTADTLIAAVDTKGYFALDSINVLKVQTSGNSIDDCCYLAGILNSEPMRKLYRFLTQEEDRVFPQVKPSNVKKLSLPNLSERERLVVIETAKSLQSTQVERARILTLRNRGKSKSVHQLLSSLESTGDDRLSALTVEYRRLKFRIDEIVLRGLQNPET